MKEKIVLIGGGGHCRSCIDVIEAENRFSIAGIIDTQEKVGTEVFGYPVIGTDEDLPISTISYYLITVGQIKSVEIRQKIAEKLAHYDVTFPVIVSPNAYVASRAVIGNGTIVMHKAVVNAGAQIGEHCIINSTALIEHDASVGSFCHISTGAVVNGGAEISSNTFIGSNSTINHLVKIPSNVVIGSGTTVRLKDTIVSGKTFLHSSQG